LTSLKNEIAELKNENITLRYESSLLSARVAQFESKPVVISDSEVLLKLLREISQGNSSEFNVIVYGSGSQTVHRGALGVPRVLSKGIRGLRLITNNLKYLDFFSLIVFVKTL
jgi:hypothetical protein